MSLMNTFNSLFKTPSPHALAARELDEARRALLAAQTAQEYAAAMVKYNIERIKRLEGILLK